MNDKFVYLLEELKENYSDSKLKEILNFIEDEYNINSINENFEKTKQAFNGQNQKLYNELAFSFVEDLNNFQEMYFMVWEPFFALFNEDTKRYFFESALNFSHSSDAEDYINGFVEFDKGNTEIALLRFNRIEYYLAGYFIAICYLEEENYQNSIKQNLYFLKYLKNKIKQIELIDLNLDPGIRLAQWNVYNDLGYSFNRLHEFDDALENFKKALDIYSLEETYSMFHSVEIGDRLDVFLIFANNYLQALEKMADYSSCIKVLEFISAQYPEDSYYRRKLDELQKNIETNKITDNILNRIFERKKPFNLVKFEETKILSKEKALEDMIVEQIKYGFKVFDKELEVYDDELIHGRQYSISSVNGRLDLLLIDPKSEIVYVVELKRNEAGVEVIEQVEKYIQGLRKEIKNEIRGIICLHKPTNELAELVRQKENIELYTYSFDFKNVV